MKEKYRELNLIIALFCLPIVVALPAIIKGNPLSRGDYISQHYIMQSYAAKVLHQGKLPLWDAWTFAGKPFAANPQGAVFYPVHWLMIPWAQPSGLPPAIFDLGYVFDLSLFLVFTYLLLHLFVKRWAAVFGALLLFFGPIGIFLYRDFSTAMSTVAWWPLLVYFLEKIRRAPTNGPYVGFSIVLAIEWLAGFPPLFFAVFLGAVVFFFCAGLWKNPIARPRLLLVTIAGFGLAAIQLIPAIEYFLLSGKAQTVSGNAIMSPSLFSVLSSLVSAETYRFFPITIGVVGLTLLLSTLRQYRNNIYIRLWWNFLFVSSGLVAALWLGLPWLHHVPALFNLIRFPERLLVLPLTGMVALISLGLQSWPVFVRHTPRFSLWLVTGTFVVSALASGAQSPTLSLIMVSSGSIILLLSIILREKFSMRMIAMMIGLFGLLTIIPSWHTAWPATGTTWATELEPLAALQTAPKDGNRIVEGGSKIRKNGAMLYDVPGTEGWDALIPKTYQQLHAAGGSALFAGRWTYSNHQWMEQPSLPSWWFPSTISTVGSEKEVLSKIHQGPLELTQKSFALPGYPWPGSQAGGQVVFAQRQSNNVQLRTQSIGSSVLVLNAVAYPGWMATIDGRRTVVAPIDGGLLSLRTPPGSHRLVFKYQPLSLYFGLGITILSSCLLFLYAARRQASPPISRN